MSNNASLPAEGAGAAQAHGHHCPLTENSSSDQRQACKKHELYVSFRDLGWQVRPGVPWHIIYQLQQRDPATNRFFILNPEEEKYCLQPLACLSASAKLGVQIFRGRLAGSSAQSGPFEGLWACRSSGSAEGTHGSLFSSRWFFRPG